MHSTSDRLHQKILFHREQLRELGTTLLSAADAGEREGETVKTIQTMPREAMKKLLGLRDCQEESPARPAPPPTQGYGNEFTEDDYRFEKRPPLVFRPFSPSPTFKRGDLVQLKSGGPWMTVSRVYKADDFEIGEKGIFLVNVDYALSDDIILHETFVEPQLKRVTLGAKLPVCP